VNLAVERVAKAAVQLLAYFPDIRFQSASHLLLKHHLVFGFAQLKSRHVSRRDQDEEANNYVNGVSVNLLDKSSTTSTCVTLSDFEQHNTVFDAGYEIGLTGLNHYVLTEFTFLNDGPETPNNVCGSARKPLPVFHDHQRSARVLEQNRLWEGHKRLLVQYF
jgi:hypothetical protein